MIGIIDDASRASFGRPDPLGVASVAPLADANELTTELRRVARAGQAGAQAFDVVERRIARARERAVELPLADAWDAWQLDRDDRLILALAIVAALDGRHLGIAELTAIAGERAPFERLDSNAALRRLRLVSLVDEDAPWAARTVRPASRVLALAAGSRAPDGDVDAEWIAASEPPIGDDTRALADGCRRATAAEPITHVRTSERDEDVVERIARVAALLGKRVLVAAGDRVAPDGTPAAATVGALVREALVAPAVLVVRDARSGLCASLRRFAAPIFVVASDAPDAVVVDLPPLSATERLAAWRAAAAESNAAGEAMAAVSRLGPATIRRVVERARALTGSAGDPVALRAALAELWSLPACARIVATDQSWNDLMVPNPVGERILETLAQARSGRGGVLARFSGAAGTGKSLTSALVARELGLPLWEVSLRRIAAADREERDAQLAALIRCVEEGAALLAVDDAERLALPDGGPVALATLRWLERTAAPVLLHTRAGAHPDHDVARLLPLEVAFAAPDKATRAQLWQRMLPELADDARELARTPATAGQIVAWCARARRIAQLDGTTVALTHVRQLLEREDGALDERQ